MVAQNFGIRPDVIAAKLADPDIGPHILPSVTDGIPSECRRRTVGTSFLGYHGHLRDIVKDILEVPRAYESLTTQ